MRGAAVGLFGVDSGAEDADFNEQAAGVHFFLEAEDFGAGQAFRAVGDFGKNSFEMVEGGGNGRVGKWSIQVGYALAVESIFGE